MAVERIVMCSESSVVCVHHNLLVLREEPRNLFILSLLLLLFRSIRFCLPDAAVPWPSGACTTCTPVLVRLKYSIATSTLHRHAKDIDGGVKTGR